MPVYTYDQFRKAAQDSGLWSQFSQADLNLAQKNPDAGMSILKGKQDFQNATTDEARALAHQRVEDIRSSYGNYSGGANGAGFYLDRLSPSSFEYEPEPTYTNRYDDTTQDLIDQLLNREDFSYDPATDPLYQNYRKQYTREGQRATADTLGAAAAATGGIPSSYATTAAAQAGNYYAAQLTDKIPELYQLAYDQYLNDYQMMLSDLNAVQAAEQNDYNKFRDQLGQYNTDRNFYYGQLLDEIDSQTLDRQEALQEALNQAQYGDYSGIADRGWDVSNIPTEREWQQYLDEVSYDRQQQSQALAQAQVDNMLQTGTMPSAELLQQAGYSQEYANALNNYYRNQLAARTSSGGTSGGYSNVYSSMYDAGIRNEGDAYAWLLSNGASSTEARELTDYFLEWMEGQAGGNDSGDSGAVPNQMLSNMVSQAANNILGLYGGQSGGGQSMGTITNANQLGSSARTIYDNMIRRNSAANAESFASTIRDALNGGRITEAEADFILSALGF